MNTEFAKALAYPYILPRKLDPRCHAPKGWLVNYFTSVTERNLHFGFHIDDHSKAIVLIVPGRAQATEKYFENINDLLAKGYGVVSIDPYGQGRSDRPAFPKWRDHSGSFDDHVADLHTFIAERLKPYLESRNLDHLPIIGAAHSKGGLKLMLTMSRHPGDVDAAVMTAPLLGHRMLDSETGKKLTAILTPLTPLHSLPLGLGLRDMRNAVNDNTALSTDETRRQYSVVLQQHAPYLRCGRITIGQALNIRKAFEALRAPGVLDNIKVPVTLITAGDERVVRNYWIRNAHERLLDSILLQTPPYCRHDIPFERDEVRDIVLGAIDRTADRLLPPPKICALG